jgi:hypothetical protein
VKEKNNLKSFCLQDYFISSFRISVPFFFDVIGRFNSVHSQSGFGTILRIIGGFRNSFERHMQLIKAVTIFLKMVARMILRLGNDFIAASVNFFLKFSLQKGSQIL